MAARRERGLFDPDAAPGDSPFDHTIWCFASDGDIEEGISHEASSLAGHQQLGNLVVIYDDNHISIEDDTKIAQSEDVAARYEAYGWHVQRVDWLARRRVRRGRRRRCTRRSRPRAPRPTGRRSSRCARSSAGRRPNKQNTGKAHGSALGADEVAATKEILGFDPDADLRRAATRCSRTPARSSSAAARRTPSGRSGFDAWARGQPRAAPRCSTGIAARRLPDGWDRRAARRSRPTPRAWPPARPPAKVLNALAPVLPELWGGSADLAESNNTTMKGEPSFLPEDARPRSSPAARTAGRCTSASASTRMGAILNGIALHGGTRAVRRHVPGLQRLHAPARCGSPR